MTKRRTILFNDENISTLTITIHRSLELLHLRQEKIAALIFYCPFRSLCCVYSLVQLNSVNMTFIAGVEIRLVLWMSRFYCEEQSLEGIICWLVDTFVVYCIHVKHTFEDYITQQTYVQQCNAMHKVQYFSIVDYILTDWVLGSLPFYRASSKWHAQRCWCNW